MPAEAAAQGLGSCILGWVDDEKIREICSLDAPVRLVITLGYAADGDKLREKKRKDTPSVVVERFAKALVECDLEQAQKDSYGNLNKIVADGAKEVDTPEKKEAWKKQFLRLKDIKIDSENIDGDSAVVVMTNGSTQTEFHLVKVNGEWKVTGMR